MIIYDNEELHLERVDLGHLSGSLIQKNNSHILAKDKKSGCWVYITPIRHKEDVGEYIDALLGTARNIISDIKTNWRSIEEALDIKMVESAERNV